jgi:hypothetical protein
MNILATHKLLHHDSERRIGNVVCRTHDRVCRRDDGHDMSPIDRVEGRVPFLQVERHCNW